MAFHLRGSNQMAKCSSGSVRSQIPHPPLPRGRSTLPPCVKGDGGDFLAPQGNWRYKLFAVLIRFNVLSVGADRCVWLARTHSWVSTAEKKLYQLLLRVAPTSRSRVRRRPSTVRLTSWLVRVRSLDWKYKCRARDLVPSGTLSPV